MSVKIIDKINALLAAEQEAITNGTAPDRKETWYSYEYFPPKTPAGEENLIERIGRMATTNPLWVDVTWGAGGSTFDKTLDICGHLTQFMGLDVLMHLTCTGLTRDRVIESLDKAKEYGIRNILALRGDPPAGVDNWVAVENGFEYATQLVQFIRERYGDYFCIVVAGYPEMHMTQTDRDLDIKYLKEKCDAGADIVITQLFYNSQIYLQWVKDCKAAGITQHIIPGIMPIFGYDRFMRTVNFCKTNVPDFLSESIEPIKNDDEKVREFGVEFGIKMCQELIDGGERFIHFYTMNLETAVVRIIKGLGILNQKKSLPFYKGHSAERKSEEVRPIFWANKPSSYVHRTLKWDEYPNGRWGDSRSPAFGGGFEEAEEVGAGFVSYSKKFKQYNIPEKLKQWGKTCTSYTDVSNVFTNYIQGKIKKFPFSEGQLALETSDLTDILSLMNQNKLFTLNSQPQVNGAKSDNEKYGWGPDKGYVYQKAYFELFVDAKVVEQLCAYLDQFPSITYQAVNKGGKKLQNVEDGQVNAVTWGIFPGREVIQPTIVDAEAFMIWKDEALNIFNNTWALIYNPTKNEKGEDLPGDEPSVAFLNYCSENLFVVNIVENDFIEGDLNKVMEEFIAANQETLNNL